MCINISFSNGSFYSIEESQAISIQQSVCLRILYQFESGFKTFQSFYEVWKNDKFTLSSVLEKLGVDASCIILGIDEVNKVYDVGKGDLLGELFKLVGGISCEFSPIFVPVLAGTVIGPIKSVVRESTHPPLHIPLPLLSFESCLNIFEKKNSPISALVRTDHHLRQLISDCGGHCRSLEILFDAMLQIKSKGPSYWNDVASNVRVLLSQRYNLTDFPLGAAIALSFLQRPVGQLDTYPEEKSLRFQDLEEKGLIKLENGIIRMPYFFVCTFMLQSGSTNYSKFWRDLLIQESFWCQDWELFNWNYIAFRLSLYAYLGTHTVSLKEFFAGAKKNIPDDIQIKIPSFESLKHSKISFRYPSTRAPFFAVGDMVLNANGAPFDSFLYLETTADPLLLAFQMKLANEDSQTPQVISDDTVNREFTKINNTISTHLPGTDFVCIILGFCRGTFDEKRLPSKCVVISREEQMNFYGESYYHRLNNRS